MIPPACESSMKTLRNTPWIRLRENWKYTRKGWQGIFRMIRKDSRYLSGSKKVKTHDERVSSERARKVPPAAHVNHGRWRVHASATYSLDQRNSDMQGQSLGQLPLRASLVAPVHCTGRDIKDGDMLRVLMSGFCPGRAPSSGKG